MSSRKGAVERRFAKLALKGELSYLVQLFVSMEKREISLCYAVIFLATTQEFGPDFRIGYYRTAGVPLDIDGKDAWFELYRQAMRWLAFERGFKFAGWNLYQDGRMTRSETFPPEIRNRLYESMLIARMMDPLVCLDRSIQMVERGEVDLPIETLRECRHLVVQAVKHAHEDVSGEMVRKLNDHRLKCLKLAGIEVVGHPAPKIREEDVN